jgi:hypothetical protein
VPTLTIIEGPNGSGKSTLTRTVEFEGRERLLDPDAIARELNPLNPSAAAIAAGREALERTAAFLNQGLSFAVETTLSSRSRVNLIREAKSRGYETHLALLGWAARTDASHAFGTGWRVAAILSRMPTYGADMPGAWPMPPKRFSWWIPPGSTTTPAAATASSWWRMPVPWCGGRRWFRRGSKCEATGMAARNCCGGVQPAYPAGR